MRVLVTGATGFVGRHLVPHLVNRGFTVRAVVRQAATMPASVEQVVIPDLREDVTWGDALNGVDAVVHLAARVHQVNETAANPLDEYRRANLAPTVRLARACGDAGVKRFVFLSSIKAAGERALYVESDAPEPADPYGVTKREAEAALQSIAAETKLEVVTIRPPLVYGPGVRANFHALMAAVSRGLPLPLGAVRNKRSLVAIDNLADFIATCIVHPAAANQVFLVSDGEDVSTADLIRRMGRALGKPARVIPVPAVLLSAAASVLGKSDVARRLLESACVDSSKARSLLGWTPVVSLDEGLRRVAADFK
jgi:nucleoside-diphosphate-sugar epimerase